MFLRRHELVETITMLLWESALVFFVGAVTLIAGLAIVLLHNVWSGSAFAVVVSLIGWLTVIKGMIFLTLTPQAETTLFIEWLNFQDYFYIYNGISLAIGLYLTYGGFFKKNTST